MNHRQLKSPTFWIFRAKTNRAAQSFAPKQAEQPLSSYNSPRDRRSLRNPIIANCRRNEIVFAKFGQCSDYLNMGQLYIVGFVSIIAFQRAIKRHHTISVALILRIPTKISPFLWDRGSRIFCETKNRKFSHLHRLSMSTFRFRTNHFMVGRKRWTILPIFYDLCTSNLSPNSTASAAATTAPTRPIHIEQGLHSSSLHS